MADRRQGPTQFQVDPHLPAIDSADLPQTLRYAGRPAPAKTALTPARLALLGLAAGVAWFLLTCRLDVATKSGFWLAAQLGFVLLLAGLAAGTTVWAVARFRRDRSAPTLALTLLGSASLALMTHVFLGAYLNLRADVSAVRRHAALLLAGNPTTSAPSPAAPTVSPPAPTQPTSEVAPNPAIK